jgi:type IV secretory pathway TrbF-like protein
MTPATARHRNYSPPGAAGNAPETPYTRARREWDARMGSAVVQAKNWRLNSMVLAGLLSGSLAGNVYLGRQPKAVPHIIEIDGLGAATYRGPAGVAAAEFVPSEGLVRYQLRRFVELTRTVSADGVVLRKNWFDAYKMLTTTGSALMTEWVRVNNPFERSQTETAAVEILSAVPLSAESWQIDWRESAWDREGGALGKPVVWRVMIRVVLQPPETMQQMIDNPLGLFVDEFHWDRIETVNP